MRQNGSIRTGHEPNKGGWIAIRTWDGIDKTDYNYVLEWLSVSEMKQIISGMEDAIPSAQAEEAAKMEKQKEALSLRRAQISAELEEINRKLAA